MPFKSSTAHRIELCLTLYQKVWSNQTKKKIPQMQIQYCILKKYSWRKTMSVVKMLNRTAPLSSCFHSSTKTSNQHHTGLVWWHSVPLSHITFTIQLSTSGRGRQYTRTTICSWNFNLGTATMQQPSLRVQWAEWTGLPHVGKSELRCAWAMNSVNT